MFRVKCEKFDLLESISLTFLVSEIRKINGKAKEKKTTINFLIILHVL